MNDIDRTIDPSKISVTSAVIAIAGTTVALVLLAALHVLSPEFSPAWRMVSEYANGRYPSVLSGMFVAYGVSSLALAFAIRSQVKSRSGRIGLAALVVSGVGQLAGAAFDLNQAAPHDLAGVLAVGALPIGAVLISRVLTHEPGWSSARRQIRWSAQLTWISVILFLASFPLMLVTFVLATGELPSAPPKNLPHGVIAIVGWTGRLSMLAAWTWTSITAWHAVRVQRAATITNAARTVVSRAGGH